MIGDGDGMLWRVPADLAHFKAETSGCPIIMGRRSWEALGGALPQRVNIVITRDPTYQAPGAIVVSSLPQALETARAHAAKSGAPRIWITGGAQVYREAIDLVDELVVSELDLTVPDAPKLARAPRVDPAVWELDADSSESAWRPVSGDAAWRVRTYRRRP